MERKRGEEGEGAPGRPKRGRGRETAGRCGALDFSPCDGAATEMGTIGGLGVLQWCYWDCMIMNYDSLYFAACAAYMGVLATEVSKLSSSFATAGAPSYQAVTRLTIQSLPPDFLAVSPPSPRAPKRTGTLGLH